MGGLFNDNFFSDGLPWGVVAIVAMAIIFGFLIPRYLYNVVVKQNTKLIETFEKIGPTLERIASNQERILRILESQNTVFRAIPTDQQTSGAPSVHL